TIHPSFHRSSVHPSTDIPFTYISHHPPTSAYPSIISYSYHIPLVHRHTQLLLLNRHHRSFRLPPSTRQPPISFPPTFIRSKHSHIRIDRTDFHHVLHSCLRSLALDSSHAT